MADCIADSGFEFVPKSISHNPQCEYVENDFTNSLKSSSILTSQNPCQYQAKLISAHARE